MQSQGNLREPQTDFSLKGGRSYVSIQRGFKHAPNPWHGEGGQEKNRKEVPAADLNFALIRYQTGTPFERF